MSGIEYPQPTEIHQYVQLASWLREGRSSAAGYRWGESSLERESLKHDFGVDRSVVRRAVQSAP